MPEPRTYDVVVVGAGPVGENVAARARRGGLSAAIVERELVGGECSYWACMPSKAMLIPTHTVAAAKRLQGAREAVSGEPDPAAVFARRDAFTHGLDDGSQVRWLEKEEIDLVRGHGRLAGERRVEVTADDGTMTVLEARVAVAVCTGSRASLPPVEGLADAAPWTSREATAASAVPERLAVLGGGVVGCEMADLYASLGSSVALLQRSDHLLPATERFAGEMVADSLRARGVDVRLKSGVERVERATAGGPVTVHLSDGTSLEADELLVAAGRTLATDDLGLSAVGLSDGGPVPTDASMRVPGVDGGWLFAAGDVTGKALLTHMGKYQARVAGDAIVAVAQGQQLDARPWSHLADTADQVAVTQVVFTDPEVAAVGVPAAQLEARGLQVRVVDYPIGWVAGGAVAADGYEGKARIVVDEERRVVLSATFVGQGVGELLHSATVAVVGEVPLERLWHAVPAYPTISEVWLRLLEEYGL